MLRPQPAASDAVDSADFVRNGNLSALFRSHANDSYLQLASDADQVGKTSQQILENTKLVAGASGALYFAYHFGDDQSRQLVYSHNGSVEITLSPIPQAH